MAPMNPPTSTHHGFKHISAANWEEPDLPCSFFCYTSDYWVEAHLKPQLGPNVPSDVVALFEVARGAMIYGWFFYPIITLGAEQCLRVLEAGVKACCENHCIPTKKRNKKGELLDTSYSDNLGKLEKHRIIPEGEENLWKVARKVRNLTSHPERQIILTPGITWGILQATADRLNVLFS